MSTALDHSTFLANLRTFPGNHFDLPPNRASTVSPAWCLSRSWGLDASEAGRGFSRLCCFFAFPPVAATFGSSPPLPPSPPPLLLVDRASSIYLSICRLRSCWCRLLSFRLVLLRCALRLLLLPPSSLALSAVLLLDFFRDDALVLRGLSSSLKEEGEDMLFPSPLFLVRLSLLVVGCLERRFFLERLLRPLPTRS